MRSRTSSVAPRWLMPPMTMVIRRLPRWDEERAQRGRGSQKLSRAWSSHPERHVKNDHGCEGDAGIDCRAPGLPAADHSAERKKAHEHPCSRAPDHLWDVELAIRERITAGEH